jgi:hypothetical protein
MIVINSPGIHLLRVMFTKKTSANFLRAIFQVTYRPNFLYTCDNVTAMISSNLLPHARIVPFQVFSIYRFWQFLPLQRLHKIKYGFSATMSTTLYGSSQLGEHVPIFLSFI